MTVTKAKQTAFQTRLDEVVAMVTALRDQPAEWEGPDQATANKATATLFQIQYRLEALNESLAGLRDRVDVQNDALKLMVEGIGSLNSEMARPRTREVVRDANGEITGVVER